MLEKLVKELIKKEIVNFEPLLRFQPDVRLTKPSRNYTYERFSSIAWKLNKFCGIRKKNWRIWRTEPMPSSTPNFSLIVESFLGSQVFLFLPSNMHALANIHTYKREPFFSKKLFYNTLIICELVCTSRGIQQQHHRENMVYTHDSSANIVSTRAEGRCLCEGYHWNCQPRISYNLVFQ